MCIAFPDARGPTQRRGWRRWIGPVVFSGFLIGILVRGGTAWLFEHLRAASP